MKITKVTVTGADDSISPRTLIEIAEEFPFVEFGILLSKNQLGCTRFPSADWLRELQRVCDSIPKFGLNLSGHICGRWVREILLGKWPLEELTALLGPDFYDHLFSRWQLNTHGASHEWRPEFIGGLKLIEAWPATVIFQYDEVNKEVLAAAVDSGAKNISALFDLSHGAGVLPDFWPGLLPGVPCGYAGGLSPENVAEQCRKIQLCVGEASIWIDTETHLRCESGRFFDLHKVRDFLRNAQPFTAEVQS